jgi:hypothetical protein
MSNDLKDSLCISTRGYRHYMSNDLKDSLCISTRSYFIKMIEYSYQSTNVVLLQNYLQAYAQLFFEGYR